VEWKVRYEPGSIEARASKDGKVILTEKRETTGPASQLRLTADRTQINADGEDVVIIKVEALDKDGRAVPTAENRLAFSASGAGKLIGVGNGDPNCQESDKEPKRSLFNGLAQVIVQSTKQAGEIHIEAARNSEIWDEPEVMPATLTIQTKQVDLRPAVAVIGSRE
jgi:beta-galactosidase